MPEVAELTEGEPEALTAENARRKAIAIAADADLAPGSLVLGVDTEVWYGGRIYGKPADQPDARSMLASLSGRSHEVVSGLCVAAVGATEPPLTATARTTVTFRELGDELLDWYVAAGEWRGRAGGYAIQGRGAALVAAIEGDYLNVVGLPLAALLEIAPDILPLH